MNEEETRPPEEPHPEEDQTGQVTPPDVAGDEESVDQPRPTPSEDIEDPAPPETQAPTG